MSAADMDSLPAKSYKDLGSYYKGQPNEIVPYFNTGMHAHAHRFNVHFLVLHYSQTVHSVHCSVKPKFISTWTQSNQVFCHFLFRRHTVFDLVNIIFMLNMSKPSQSTFIDNDQQIHWSQSKQFSDLCALSSPCCHCKTTAYHNLQKLFQWFQKTSSPYRKAIQAQIVDVILHC